MSESDLYHSVLCAHLALAGEIASELRAVFINILPENYVFEVNYYFDCEITDEVIDAPRDATSYLSSNYRWAFGNEIENFLYWPYPKPFSKDKGICVYLRYEQYPASMVNLRDLALASWGKVTEELKNEIPNLRSFIVACFFQKAFLGKIVPSLRAASVSLNKEDKIITSFFVFDGEITPFFYQLIESACREVQAELPSYAHKWHIECQDHPQKVEVKGERLFFFRKEEMDSIPHNL